MKAFPRSTRHSPWRAHCRWAFMLLALLFTASLGCTRAYYRQQADNEAYDLISKGTRDPRWELDRFVIAPAMESRFYDPHCPDYEPMPPDDPTSHQLMHCVDCKKGWPCWHRSGDTPFVENPNFDKYLPYDEQGRVILDLQGAVQVAAVNSRDYQNNLEELYLSALDVTFERFRFDTQFFAANDTFFTASGAARGGGQSSSILDVSTDLQARRLFATGGEAVVGLANTLMWQFAGPDTYTANTLLNFSLIQPLLRGAGRQVVMERLTLSERTLLANIRAMERYRKGFFVQLASGRNAGNGPQRRGGLFGGAGFESFTGVGAGGFGRVGGGGGGGGGAGGFAGGAGAGNAGGFLGLLQNRRQIANQRANVAGLRQSLELLEAFYAANRIDRLQVDQARQALFTAQSQLLIAEASYQTALDNYKNTLGLPPCLPLDVRDDRLDQFELLSPEALELQDDAGLMVARLWTAPPEENGQAAEAPTQALRTAAAQLVRDEQLLAAASEILKLAQYLVPPDDNALRPLRDRFRVYEARLESLRQQQLRLERVLIQLENAPNALALADPLQERALELLPEVKASLDRLEDQRDDRIRTLRNLSAREEVASGKVDRRAFDVAGFESRIANLPTDFAAIEARLEQPNQRWEQWQEELLEQYDRASALVNQLTRALAPLRPVVDRLQQELSRPERTELPEELGGLIVELNRLLDDPDRSLAGIDQDLVALESMLNEIGREVVVLSEDAANLGLIQARAKLDASTVIPIELDPKVALKVAAQNRLDWMNTRAGLVDSWRLIEFNANALQSSLDVVFNGDINTLGDNPFRFRDTTGRLQVGLRFDAPITRQAERNTYRQALIEYQQARRSYMNFVDGISRSLRNTLRTIELNQMNFELRRAAVRVALDQVELARFRLQEPPRPAVETAFGATTARDLVSALGDLNQVQNEYLSVWVNYEQQRMELDLDLGTLRLDDRGMWIDPGPIDKDHFEDCLTDEEGPVDQTLPPELLLDAPTLEPGTLQPGMESPDLENDGTEAEALPEPSRPIRLLVPPQDEKSPQPVKASQPESTSEELPEPLLLAPETLESAKAVPAVKPGLAGKAGPGAETARAAGSTASGWKSVGQASARTAARP